MLFVIGSFALVGLLLGISRASTVDAERHIARAFGRKQAVNKADDVIYRIFASWIGLLLYCIMGLVALYFLVR